MKLAIYTDSYLPSVDGVSAVCQAYARFLPQEGMQCCVFAPAFPGCSAPGTVPISSLPLPGGFQYRLALPFADSRLLRCEQAFSPDIIHAHSPFAVGWRAVATARRLRVPLVASFHTNYQADFLRALHAPWAVRPLLKGIAAFYAAADEVWTMNPASASMLRSYGYRGSIWLLPHGSAAHDGSEDVICRAAVLQQLQPDTSRLLFLYVGQIVHQKNIAQTLKALALLRGRLDFQMYFVGKGRDLEPLSALSKALGLADRVIFTGYLSNQMVRGLYLLADLFVFPSSYDTAGLVVAEAAAAGLPALVLRGSGAATGIVDCRNGFLCEDSPSGIAQAIWAACKDRSQLWRCGEAARKSLVIGWPDICHRAAKRYQALLSSSGTADRRDRPRRTEYGQTRADRFSEAEWSGH